MTKPSTIAVGVHEAKTRLSELLRAVAVGQEVEICRNGVPIAKLVPTNARQQRQFGYDAGRFVVPDDFDEELPGEVLAGFEG
jgi:prevent-host-death family protein